MRYRRIDTDVAYYDPNAPAPPLETDQKPERKVTGEGAAETIVNLPYTLIAATILAVIVMLFVRYGGGLSVSMRGGAANPGRGRRKGAEVEIGEEELTALGAIRAMPDRRQALIALAQNALSHAVLANGLLLQKSWTARDALRRLPAGQNHLAALRDLVLASERVHFGGRDVSDAEFDMHLANVRPLFAEAAQ